MAPNPKIEYIAGLRNPGEVVAVGALNPLHIKIRNIGTSGDVFLNIYCTSESTAPTEPSYAKGIRLKTWKPLAYDEEGEYEAIRALIDEVDPTGYGLCGGCHPDGDCWPDPAGATYFVVQTGERYTDGSLRVTHEITGPVFYVGSTAPPPEPPPEPPPDEEENMSMLTLWAQDQDGNPVSGGRIRIFQNIQNPIYIQDVVGTPASPAVVELDPGTYVLHPWPIDGYDAYDVVVVLAEGVHLERYVVYTLVEEPPPPPPPPPIETGNVLINTIPVAGEIFVNNTSQGFGTASVVLEAGVNATVSFGAVVGFTKPNSVNVSVNADETVNVTGEYIPIEVPPPPPPVEEAGFPWWLVIVPVGAVIGAKVLKKRR